MPALIFFSCFLLTVIGVSLGLLLALGLPRTLSDDELVSLGLDCDQQSMSIAEFFEPSEFANDDSTLLTNWSCAYRGSLYNAYPTSSYKQAFEGILLWTCFKSILSDNERELMALQRAEGGLSEHAFQVGQYVFQADNAEAAQRLRQLFADSDWPVSELALAITCDGAFFAMPGVTPAVRI